MTYPDIELLVPHRAPMLFIDAIKETGHKRLSCTARVRETHPLLQNGKVDIVATVEYVAQTVSAYVGYNNHLARPGTAPGIGFLVSCNEAVFSAADLNLDDELDIVVEHVWGESAFGKFRGEVKRNDVSIATMDVSVVGESAFERGFT